MAGTLPFGPVTMNPGTRDFPAAGGRALADADTMAQLVIDRTIPGGLDSLTAATTISISIFQSNDAGGTWDLLGGTGIIGGPVFDRHTGQNDTTAGLNVSLHPGTGRLARAEVVIGGPSAVAVQGTLTIS